MDYIGQNCFMIRRSSAALKRAEQGADPGLAVQGASRGTANHSLVIPSVQFLLQILDWDNLFNGTC